eukprot:9734504-Prorocentrum_lima.AAC.1
MTLLVMLHAPLAMMGRIDISADYMGMASLVLLLAIMTLTVMLLAPLAMMGRIDITADNME